MRLPLTVALTVALATPLAWGQSDERASMLTWINAARSAEGLAPLAADARLDAVADAHARDMAGNRFFSHTSPSTGAPTDRAAAAGIGFRALAENIAMNQSVRAAHDALLRSPGHRANLLDGGLRRVGIGLARGPGGIYVTQLFATLPEDLGAAPSPAPAAPSAPVAVPAAPDALPQVFDAISQRIDPRGWGASRGPRAPARSASGVWTVPTPFGPLRVRVPSAPAAPRVEPEARDGWDDDDAPACPGGR